MNNGEKFKQIFSIMQVDEGELYAFAWLPNHNAAEFCIDWWNAEYEPTTKNDLGVDYISKQEVVGLMMHIWGKNHSGDDAMQECIDAIREMPSVTPQEPQTFKWCTDCKEYDQEKHCCHRWSKVIRNTVEEMKQEQEPILDKIREQIKDYLRGVEITLEVLVENNPLRPKMEGAKDTLEECLELIDKAETEEEDGECK